MIYKVINSMMTLRLSYVVLIIKYHTLKSY